MDLKQPMIPSATSIVTTTSIIMLASSVSWVGAFAAHSCLMLLCVRVPAPCMFSIFLLSSFCPGHEKAEVRNVDFVVSLSGR